MVSSIESKLGAKELLLPLSKSGGEYKTTHMGRTEGDLSHDQARA